MSYQPPLPQIQLAMRTTAMAETETTSSLSEGDIGSILSEAGKFAAERLAPLNRVGDQNPARLENGQVITPPGWQQAYHEWRGAGWNSLTGPIEHGGQGLPASLAVACTELWNSACLSFALCPLLTASAIEAIAAHASEDLKQFYLPKLISGEWTGTMNLTEPQAGSDLSLLRCKAQRNNDGTYRISGNKIFITFGEHEWSSNIVHLVLARLDDAPEGTRGISLFLVPKYLPDGTRNDLRCHSLEHKLGIHGSPTCAMVYGDGGGATAWLVGEEHRGLACMFTMMNNARLLVGVQGVALAERATQAAVAFAMERRQGRATGTKKGPSPIIDHPDIRRMLLEMKAKTAAARLLCMATASAIDASTNAASDAMRNSSHARASLLTPLAKSYATDIAVEVASAAVQLHGGMGFIEETGVAQFYRDARILPIYEGTNGIQAIDLVTRKLTLEGGAIVALELQSCRASLQQFEAETSSMKIVDGVTALTAELAAAQGSPAALAAATPVLRALATLVAGGLLARAAVLARNTELAAEAAANARFFLDTEIPSALAAAQGTWRQASTILDTPLA